MTRNLKAFGLALVAMLALGAFAAQGASAVVEHSFRSGAESTNLTGSAESTQVFTATAGLAIECTAATFGGTVTGTTADKVTVYPQYSSCGEGTSVDNTGCVYEFDSETTQASGHSTSSEHASVSLNCGHKHWIEITKSGCYIAFEDTHTSSNETVNQNLHGVRYDEVANDSGKKAITVTATVKTIAYTVTAGSFCGLVGHPAGTYTNGTYSGNSSVTGYEDSGVSGTPTEGTTWTHGSQVDIFLSTPT